MFTKRTIRPAQAVEHVDTASEALAVSISEKAQVDMPYMGKLTGKTEQELVADLRGVIFPLPVADAGEPMRYAPADEYLSGNIREKLEAAKSVAEADSRFLLNVEALEKAMPKALDASEIDVRLGATWIDKSTIQSFMQELLNPPSYLRHSVTVNYSPVTAEWSIANKSSIPFGNIAAFSTYGTDRASAYRILEKTLNLRDIRIYDTVQDADGKEKRVLNSKETTLAQQKQQAVKDAFRDWVWNDPDRRQALTEKYNVLFNSIRLREYNGEHTRHFFDDGTTGVRFDRDGWQELMEEVEAGNVSTIITKDLSRMGREHIQTGMYLELFRQRGIRFIAITNGVDSANPDTLEFVPFLNIFSEWFARDTSKKSKPSPTPRATAASP